jgi:putative two-component system response regulator
MPFDAAREIIVLGRGSHFDPDVVDTFVAAYDRFIHITMRVTDEAVGI